MPSSNWHGPYAFVALGIVFLSLAGWAVWDISASQTEVSMRREQNAAQHIEYAQDRIRQTCLDRDYAALLECVTEEIIAANDHGRAESDLDAQQAMALWAKLMTLASVAGTGLTALGIYLVWGTLSETRKATLAAQSSAEAAIADQRPWLKLSVGILGDVFFDEKDVRVIVAWKIKNVGRSPATAVNVQVSGAPLPQDTIGRKRTRDFATGWASKGLSNENITLFPEVEHSGSVSIPLNPNDLPPGFLKLFEDGVFMPEIYVVVAYRMSQHAKVMVTSTCLNLNRKSPHGLGFYATDLPLPAGDFELRRSMLMDETT
jgi:hypothetical protein